MVNRFYQKKQRKASQRRMGKIPKSFCKTKRWEMPWNRYKNLSEDEKQNKVEYMQNDYLGRKKM